MGFSREVSFDCDYEIINREVLFAFEKSDPPVVMVGVRLCGIGFSRKVCTVSLSCSGNRKVAKECYSNE